MGKNKRSSIKASNKGARQKSSNATAPVTTQHLPTTTSAIRENPDLGWRIRVLIHDFLNVTKDPNASKRINSTTDEHYLSAPYFDGTQSANIRYAIVDVDLPGKYNNSIAPRGLDEDGHVEEDNSYESILQSQSGQTFEQPYDRY